MRICFCLFIGACDTKKLSFVNGKTRVAPKKKLSISRVELKAEVITTIIKNNILETQGNNVSKVYM